MGTNTFKKIYDRLDDAFQENILSAVSESLSQIKGNVIIIGTGGSYCITKFLEKVLEEKNNCFVKTLFPRDVLYTNLTNVDWIIAFSYSGKSPSVIKALNNSSCKKLIFTCNGEKVRSLCGDISIVDYHGFFSRERSFISISGTVVPICLIAYYYDKKIDFKKMLKCAEGYIDEKFVNVDFSKIINKKTVEILTGDFTYTAEAFLKTCLLESGLAYVVSHEKNDFCHGKIILNYKNETDCLFYLKNKVANKQDLIIVNYLSSRYKNIFILESNNTNIEGELDLFLKALYLMYKIARDCGISLTRMDYPKDIGILYSYKGEM